MNRLIAIALTCLAAPALAQDVDCSDFGALAQQEMNMCAYQDWEAADADLNQIYKVVVEIYERVDADMPPELGGGLDALRAGQRAWVTFRDKTCEAEGFPMRGGSAEPLLVYGCMRRLTEERVGHLQGMVEAFGG